jgi:hypothetical protein
MYEFMTPEEEAQYEADFAWLKAYRADPITLKKVLAWGKNKSTDEQIGRVRASHDCPISRAIRQLYNVLDHVCVQVGLHEYDPNGKNSVYSVVFAIRGTGFHTMDLITEPELNRFAHEVDNVYPSNVSQLMLYAEYIHRIV